MPAYNTDRILNRLEDFSRIKTKYCNEYYQDFHNSYIYKTSDLYFLKSKLNTYYERIYNSYEKIYAYWRTFFDDICNIDASIAGNPAGSISDSTVSSLIRNLPTLPEYNNNAQTLFGSAYASAHGSAHQSVEWLKWAKENPEEAQDLVFSTSAVVVGSIISGTAKVGEHIVESFVWVGGALAEGAIWLGYFFSDMSNEDRDFMLNDIKESTMDTIAEDWVGQGQQYFYENTEIGRDINAKSAIKYDSETAQIIQGVSEQVSVKLLEVAANLIPGGGPVISGIIGATYAAGSKAEEKFSDVENRDFWADSAIIAVNGVVGYADGYMTGKMTQTAVSGIKNIKAANSIKETLKQVGNSKVTKDGVQKLLKRTAVETFKEFDFYTDALGASADTIESAVEAKEWTLNDTMAIVSNVGVSYFTNFLGNLGGNMFEDAMMGVDIDKMHSSPSAKSDTLELEKLQKEYDDLIAYKNSDKFKTDEAYYRVYRDKIGGNPYKQNMDRLEELELEFDKYRIEKVSKSLDQLDISSSDRDIITEKLCTRYKNARTNANGKYNKTFKSYRDHGELHVLEVADYSKKMAQQNVHLNDSDVMEVYFAGLTHDLGMKDSFAIIDPESGIVKLAYEIDGGIVRKNHPLNSALIVLQDSDVLPKGMDTDKVALLTLTHSKSTSGITDFSDKKMWTKAIDNLDVASKKLGIDFDADRMKKIINDDNSFKKIQEQAVCLRDGDAMSKVPLDANGNQIMQTGQSVILINNNPRKDFNDTIKEDSIEFKYDDKSGKLVPVESALKREMDDISDTLSSGEKIDDVFGKAYHIGENNVRFNSNYTGEGEYVADVYLVDANNVPNASGMVISERVGEINTYGNIDSRKMFIHLPKGAENTKLGDFYKNFNYGNNKEVRIKVLFDL